MHQFKHHAILAARICCMFDVNCCVFAHWHVGRSVQVSGAAYSISGRTEGNQDHIYYMSLVYRSMFLGFGSCDWSEWVHMCLCR